MIAIKQSAIILNHNEEKAKENMNLIELAGRTCYKSTLNEETRSAFIKQLVKSGHESVIEHVNVSFLVVTNRGVSHQIVRHRIASYSQESTRYCNYSKDKFSNNITFILPLYIEKWLDLLDKDYLAYHDDFSNDALKKQAIEGCNSESKELSHFSNLFLNWIKQMEEAEYNYMENLNMELKTDWARGVLPNDTKTELVMTMNLREWRHFIKLRTGQGAHPQIRELASMILKPLKHYYPEVFFDL